ncbi:MAG: doxx family protein [Crocinitomicaceae bacterium]
MKKIKYLAISIGLIYIWFGTLKFFPGASPAESLGSETVHILTLKLIPIKVGYFLLALLEVAIGIGLFFEKFRQLFTLLALNHMILTFSPLLLFPEQVFAGPFIFTILGQYIMKNIVIIMALIIILPKKAKAQKSALQTV